MGEEALVTCWRCGVGLPHYLMFYHCTPDGMGFECAPCLQGENLTPPRRERVPEAA